MAERLLHWTAVVALAAALLLVLRTPGIVTLGWGAPLLPTAVHLVTLGALLSLTLRYWARLWPALYGATASWRPLLWAAATMHIAGVALLVLGFVRHDTALAYWGGHYGVPTGALLALIHGWVAARRRTPGRPRRLAAHLPGLGLAVAASLGALLVMDAHTGAYGIYGFDTILVHALSGAFLFLLPLLLLPSALEQSTDSTPAALARWYAATAIGAGGVLLVALSVAGSGPPRMFFIGLALLGALLVWLGLPPAGRAGVAGLRVAELPARAGLLATGALGIYAALRYARGAQLSDGIWLAKVGGLLFLLAVALPGLLALAERGAATHTARRQTLWLAGTALLLAGQFWDLPLAVRAGALVWLAGLGWHVAAARRG